VVSNGGVMADYRGYGKASKPMLPMIAVPTSAGTGSEVQTFATLTDVESRKNVTYGDAKLWFRTAILDPKLTVTQSAALTAVAGYDALSHALESLVATRQNALSDCFSRSAWRLLHSAFERVIDEPGDLEARGAMLLGAHFGGLAVENSMLGAAHALAHALSAAFDLALRWVVEWNSAAVGERYGELYGGGLVGRLGQLAEMAGLPLSLRDAGVPREALPRLAEDAGSQWPGRFNPRPFQSAAALEILEMAY
jgi:alcohol dehydrogenase